MEETSDCCYDSERQSRQMICELPNKAVVYNPPDSSAEQTCSCYHNSQEKACSRERQQRETEEDVFEKVHNSTEKCPLAGF
jgi:hypothetical protein